MVDVQWIGVIRIYYICIVLDVITFHNSLVNNQRMKKEKGEDVCRGYNSSIEYVSLLLLRRITG